MMNVNDDLKTINKESCHKTFEGFSGLHDKEIERLKVNHSKIVCSMGI